MEGDAVDFFLHAPPGLEHAVVMTELLPDTYLPLVRMALAEDVGSGDATTRAVVEAGRMARASIVARQPLVVAGLAVAHAVFQAVNPEVRVSFRVQDAQACDAGETLIDLEGPARGILTGERVALNFLQRLSGVATLTAHYVKAVAGTGARILDTRKTTPGWRLLEKYAVQCGGGANHRMGLYDLVMIKDNHLAALAGSVANPVAEAVGRARRAYPTLRVEVEADTLDQVRHAVVAGADIILLDNMTPAQLREAVSLVQGRCRTEASGGIQLGTVRAVAEAGVDDISVGALTHSAPAVDIALDFQWLDGSSPSP